MDLLLTFDTEDVFHPPEAGSDDIIKDLAEILSDEGVPGNFIFVAKRACLLAERNRRDVIEAVGRHTVGVHTLGYEQPWASVRAAETDWRGGLEIYRQEEREGVRLVSEALGRAPACLSSHASNAAPQALVVAAELGLPYLYGYAAAPPLYNVSRYCGALNLPYAIAPQDVPAPYFDNYEGKLLDDALSNEADFKLLMRQFGLHVDACVSAGQPLLMVHPCHPYRVRAKTWVEGFLAANGKNIPPDARRDGPQPGLRSDGEVKLARRNFREFVRTIRRHPKLTPVSLPEVASRYGTVPDAISREDLLASAQRACATERIVIHGRFTPAEQILGYAQALTGYARERSVPRTVRRLGVLGPLEDPLMVAEPRGEVPWDALAGVAETLLSASKATGHLPANLTADNGTRLGLGIAYGALARAFLVLVQTGVPPRSVPVGEFERQPKIGVQIGTVYATRLAETRMVKPNLDISGLYRYAKLQSWTLAASWFPDEQRKRGQAI